MDPVYRKFHPLLGSDLAITLEANFHVDDKIVRADIPNARELTHEKNGALKLYYPAVEDGANMLGFHEGWIQFVPWFDFSAGTRGQRIGFYSQAFMSDAKNFSLWFGRHGEEKPFTFDRARHGYIFLDFMSQNPVFNPVYVKARNRKMNQNDMPEFVSFVIEASPEKTEDGSVILTLKHVSEEELPVCLMNLLQEA